MEVDGEDDGGNEEASLKACSLKKSYCFIEVRRLQTVKEPQSWSLLFHTEETHRICDDEQLLVFRRNLSWT